MLPDNTSILIVLGSLLLISLFYLFSGKPIHNEGTLQTKPETDNTQSNESTQNENENENDNESEASSEGSVSNNSSDADAISDAQADADDAADSSLEIIRERAMGLNGPYYRRK